MHPPQNSNLSFAVNTAAIKNVMLEPNWVGDFPPTLVPTLVPSTIWPLNPDESTLPSRRRALDFFPNNTITTQSPVQTAWRIMYDRDKVTASIDVPGVKLEDLEVIIENGIIKVTGKRFDNGYVVNLVQTIGVDYDPESSAADLEAGVLTIVVKKFDKVVHRVNVKGK